MEIIFTQYLDNDKITYYFDSLHKTLRHDREVLNQSCIGKIDRPSEAGYRLAKSIEQILLRKGYIKDQILPYSQTIRHIIRAYPNATKDRILREADLWPRQYLVKSALLTNPNLPYGCLRKQFVE